MAKHVSGEVARELGLAYTRKQAREQEQEYLRGFEKGVCGYKDNNIQMFRYYNGLVAPGEFFARGYVDGWNETHIESNGKI